MRLSDMIERVHQELWGAEENEGSAQTKRAGRVFPLRAKPD